MGNFQNSAVMFAATSWSLVFTNIGLPHWIGYRHELASVFLRF